MLRKGANFLKKAYDYVMWDIIYTAMYGTLAGIGNAAANYQYRGSILEGVHNDNVYHGFGEGFINMAVPTGILVNFAYPVFFDRLKKTKHFRFWANALNISVMNGGFLALHFALGTENPFAAQVLPLIVGTAAVNIHVSAIRQSNRQNDLESKVEN
ncbi:MAG: hypothetical protein IIA87_02320 [Nanoarchaeota archaeon]|nr:hypothetical protein [Nanoarchaeota archaeon]